MGLPHPPTSSEPPQDSLPSQKHAKLPDQTQETPSIPSSSSPSQPHQQHAASLPSHPSEDDPRRRLARKLQKRNRNTAFVPSMDLPDRLKPTGDEEPEEDVLPVGMGNGNGLFMNMNQSIFGLIAAAGSNVDFHDRFEGQSSDEEEGEEMEDDDAHRGGKATGATASEYGAQTTVLPKSSSSKHHKRKFSDSKLMRSVPMLSRLSSKSRSKKDEKKSAPQIQELEPESPIAGEDTENRLAPVMSRMLEARAEMSARPSFDVDQRPNEQGRGISELTDVEPTELSRRLQKIFEFDEPEELISEYPCWLLQSVLLQGYIYITAKHICFYAYLPKKAHEIAKSGYLTKSGKRNPKYHRYWFRLRGDVLSYFRDSSNLYFPHGQIDLRYGISASVTNKEKDGTQFAVVTDHRTYHFRADSAPSAKEWVKCLQRVIFRSHNDGDSIKISLPIENILDIEETQMLDFADTCKIRVIDNDETYAIDEYFFSFFSFGKEALRVLKILVEDSSIQQAEAKQVPIPATVDEGGVSDVQSSKRSSFSGPRAGLGVPTKIRTSKLQDNVKATLSPMSPTSPPGPSPRPSGDFSRASFDAIRQMGRKSMDLIARADVSRRSFSNDGRSRSRNNTGNMTGPLEKYTLSDSYIQSMEDPSLASMSGMATSSEADQSASQILRGSEVFHSPTVHRATSASQKRDQRSPSLKLSDSSSSRVAPHHAAATGHVDNQESGDKVEPATPTLQSITKISTFPLQRAGAFADYLNRHSKRMGSMLATESMGYVEKVSGMWKGGQKHYDEPAALRIDDDMGEEEDEAEEKAGATDRFRAHFAMPKTEKLRSVYFGYLMRVLPLYGKVYLSDRYFCFRSLLYGTRTKLILPLKDIETADKEKGFRFGYSGLVVVIRGHEELFFEFKDAGLRDDCAISLLQGLEVARFQRDSEILDAEEQELAETAVAERNALQEARHEEFPDHELKLPLETSNVSDGPTILFDDPKASILDFTPKQSLRITCLTIGSRGDVQPYIALCKGLRTDGHKVRIATHIEFKDWIEGHGIEFAPVEGDPAELMRLCIQNGTFTVSFLREANATMRSWIEGLLSSSWDACRGSDVLIESPSAMAGIHIAEKLGIPYFRAFGMPWTRTRAYPHAFIMPDHKMGGAYNYITYVMFDNVFWKATAHQINRWRNKTLGLPNTNLEKMQPNKVPFLYNFSHFVVPPPLDYSDWIRVTGYWFLDEGGKDWTPPRELMDFIEKARRDEKKLVYIGFGSIILDNPSKLTRDIIDAVKKADVRCILSKGWSDRVDPKTTAGHSRPTEENGKAANTESQTEIPLPPEIFLIKSAPHDWLFDQIDAAVHHGGSGTTGASLRAGIPTIIRPFFGDQYFFGSRVEDLGVGMCLKKWGVNSFARALWEATHSERMIIKAKVLGENIRKENGVDNAIQCIYRDMAYARELVEKKADKNAAAAERAAASNSGSDDIDDDIEEESWTFVGEGPDGVDEFDVDHILRRSMAENDAAIALSGLVGIAGGGVSAARKPTTLGSKALASGRDGITLVGSGAREYTKETARGR